MITKTTASVNGVKLAFQYEGFEFSKDGKKARVTKPRVVIIRDVPIVDHKNHLTISGGTIVLQRGQKANTYFNLNCSGVGKKILKRFTGKWVDLDAKKNVRKMLNVTLKSIDWVDRDLSLSGYIVYPISQGV